MMKCVVADGKTCVVIERPIPVPHDREVLVKIWASALNRADTLQRKGLYPAPPGASDVLGLELAGEIIAVGPKVQSGWRPGQHVMALLSGGGYAQYAVVDERLLMQIPQGFSMEQAAAVPETWLTAFQLLRFVAQVHENDVVLVHAAGSGVAIAAIQLAISMGARVIAIAGTDEKLQTARSLGAFASVNYKKAPAFSREVLAATSGKGVDVILDPIGGGGHMEQNIEAIALDGRWVLYGLMGGVQPSAGLLSVLLAKRVAMRGTTLRSRSIEYKENLVQQFSLYALPKFNDGSYKVRIEKIFALADVNTAHAYMESDVSNGKMILSLSHSEPPSSNL